MSSSDGRGHHDDDHGGVQLTTRQVLLLFSLLMVIGAGVLVGGIVIGRGMAPDAAEATMARRTSPVPAPPPAKAAPTSVAEVPEEDTFRLPIRPEPRPAARTASTTPSPAPAPRRIAPTRPDPYPARAAHPANRPAPPPATRTASTRPEQLSNRTLAAPAPRAADLPRNPGSAKFTIQVAAFRDRAAAERMLEQLAARGIEGYLEGTPAGIFRVRVGQFESREAARTLAARLESEQFATLVTSR